MRHASFARPHSLHAIASCSSPGRPSNRVIDAPAQRPWKRTHDIAWPAAQIPRAVPSDAPSPSRSSQTSTSSDLPVIRVSTTPVATALCANAICNAPCSTSIHLCHI